jgi:hypothetical protein
MVVAVGLKPSTWRAWRARNGSKRWYWRAPLAAEWGLERFVYCLRSLALFDLLELAGRVTVLVAVIFWFLEAGDRAKERHYRAWDLINAARGSTGDGGRRDALQDLKNDHVSLAAAPLEKAWLPRVDLKGAHLAFANLQGASLVFANLQDAYLRGANLQGASLTFANLQGAWLGWANMKDADAANLQGADLRAANLQSAELRGADLQGANLQHANLQGANLQGADVGWANLQGAKGLTQEQLNATKSDHRTVLPEGLTRPAHWQSEEGEQSGGATGQ